MPTTTATGNKTSGTADELAAEHAHDAFRLGEDAEGAVHYWSTYHQTVIVVSATTITTYALDETPYSTLGEWVAHVGEQRGWATEPRVSDSIVGKLADGLDK